MSHLDPDVAALLAMGDDVPGADLVHLESCPECRAEVAAYSRAVTAGRAASSEGGLLTPPDRVWNAIAAELSLPAVSGEPVDNPPADAAPADAAPADAAPAAAVPAHHVARRTGRRLRRRPLLLALGTAVVAAVVVTGVWVSGGIVPRAAVVAEAALDGFPEWGSARGEAALERVDGHSRVVVSLDASVPDDGYREVWLLKSDASDLVSLGILEGTEGVFPVPDDLDLEQFTIVDISQEESDGDPAHSGDSIVRGALGST
ncbi:anti-sigma factor [Microbacterium sp. 179-B 1A2 NHS]|uniref:anti-sigma factor n=1 Tax=Microbacterium sp. 179-B 1A2 NHS TaxID=3142383 RepID=UPI0039A34635